MYEYEKDRLFQFLILSDDDKVKYFGYKTQTEFAKNHGLTDKKISEWKHSKNMQKKVEKAFSSSVKDLLPRARKTLEMRAIEDGDVSALKELFKIAGVSVERTENMSEQDIQEVLQVVMEELQVVLKDFPDKVTEFAERLQERLGEFE